MTTSTAASFQTNKQTSKQASKQTNTGNQKPDIGEGGNTRQNLPDRCRHFE